MLASAPLLLALLLGAGAVVGLAQDPVRWPTPPAGWWSGLQGGERATYEVRQGEHAARRVLRLEKVEGAELTLSLEERTPDGATRLGCASATIDASGDEVQGDLNLPAGATLTRAGAETLVVGARSLACDIYEVTIKGPLGRVTMTAWHCPRLPPVFMGGTVKLRSKAEGVEATITLVDYEGQLLAEPAAPAGPR
jgi:hypothetical protein